MRIGWLAAELGIPVSLGNTFLEVGVHMACALPEVEWLEYSFQNFDHLVDQPDGDPRRLEPMRRTGPATAWCCPRPPAATGRARNLLARDELGAAPSNTRLAAAPRQGRESRLAQAERQRRQGG